MNQLLLALLQIYLLTLPFGQLLRIPTSYVHIPIHVSDLVVGTIYLFWLFGFATHKHKKQPTTPLHKPIAIFSLVALISLLFSAFAHPLLETAFSGLYLFRWVAYASLFIITATLSRKKKFVQQLNKNLIFSFTLIAILGFAQYLVFPNLKPLFGIGWDEHYYRLTSTFWDPGFTGMLLLMGLIFILDIKTQLNNFYKLIWGFLLYSALALTYSRASYIALLSALSFWLWFKKSLKYTIIAFLIISASWVLLPRPVGEGGDLSRTSTINFRLINYQQALQIIKEHPVLGIGFNRLRYVKRDYGFLNDYQWQTSHSASGFDNSFLFIFATTGILGLIVYLWLWVKALKISWGNSEVRKSLKYREKPKTLFLILIALLIHSQFHNTLFYPPVMGITWILLGLNVKSITK